MRSLVIMGDMGLKLISLIIIPSSTSQTTDYTDDYRKEIEIRTPVRIT